MAFKDALKNAKKKVKGKGKPSSKGFPKGKKGFPGKEGFPKGKKGFPGKPNPFMNQDGEEASGEREAPTKKRPKLQKGR